jgi:hypothetical protein
MVSTVGYQHIQLQFWHRGSGTASRYATLQYTTDGINWVDYDTYLNGPPHDTFFEHNYDFTEIAEVNDNPNFGVRMLAIFSPEPFTDGAEPFTEWGANEAYRAVRDDRNYSPAGTWRFDDVTFFGSIIIGMPELDQEQLHIYTAWNQLVIESGSERELKVQVYNMMGQQMMQGQLAGQNIYRLSHRLPPAAYIVRITSNNSIISRKIIVSQ